MRFILILVWFLTDTLSVTHPVIVACFIRKLGDTLPIGDDAYGVALQNGDDGYEGMIVFRVEQKQEMLC